MRRAECGVHKQLMNSSPGSVVSNRHLGVEDYTPFLGFDAVVLDRAAHDRGIGNGYDLGFWSEDTSDQERFFRNRSRSIANLHPIADQERTHVGEDDARDRIGYS